MLIVCTVVLVAAITATVPLAYAMGLASIAALAVSHEDALLIVTMRLIGGVNSFVLLAIPFYILAGSLMDTGGISRRLVKFSQVLVGHVRGGLGMVALVAEYIFSGISGSTVADISAIGSLMAPALRHAGYSGGQTVSIICAATSMGSLVPPSVGMIVLSSIMGISVAGLFFAGFLPAAAIALVVAGLIYVDARRRNMATERRATLRELGTAFKEAAIPLVMPLIIFGGILGGVTTATEAGAIAVLYALVVGLFVYKELSPRQLLKVLMDTGVITGIIVMLVGLSTVLAWILATQQVPAVISQFLVSLALPRWAFLLVIILLFLPLGAVLEVIPAFVIFVPLLLAPMNLLGIHPVHFAIVVYTAVNIGIFLPPLGVGFLLTCAIVKTEMEAAVWPFLPYLLTLLLGVLIVAYVPWLSLGLPRFFGLLR